MTQSQRLLFVLLFLSSFIEVHSRANLPPHLFTASNPDEWETVFRMDANHRVDKWTRGQGE